MIQDLRIIHRRKPSQFCATEFSGIPVWSTCLRSLAFVPGDFSAPLEVSDEVYAGQEAYQFLLEIACGLHSPILGETEVFGQFKVFSQEWLKAQPGRATLVQRILNDAKAIRSEHLSGLGNQSYGSWVRKNLQDKRVHILGAGILAREILPYLVKQGRDVVLHVRDITKIDFFSGSVHEISQNAFDHGAVLVAAPMSRDEIVRWLQGCDRVGQAVPSQIFDLRETSSSDGLELKTKTHLLSDIFEQIEHTKKLLLPRIEKVREEIRSRGEKAAEHFSLHRPKGWDDICA